MFTRGYTPWNKGKKSKSPWNVGKVPWNKGVPMSQESKDKLSASKKGKKQSPETIAKRTKALKGQKRSEDFRQQMRELNLGRKATPEARKNISAGRKGQMVGEKNPRWVSDRTNLKTGRKQAYDSRYKIWMKQVKDRDNWKCRINNQDCSGRLEAHHIELWSKSPELRYEVNNGISLCHHHHPRQRKEEQRLAPVFQEMVIRPVYEQAITL